MANLNFQHRHYVAIAEALAEARRGIRNDNAPDAQAVLAGTGVAEDELVRLFVRTNPKFDVARFRACAAGSPINGRDK